MHLRIHWRLSVILKTSKKVFFWYLKLNIFWKHIQYIIHWAKTQMLQKFPSGKRNGTKYALVFLPRAPSHHSFTFNFWFLYEPKHKVRLRGEFSILISFRFYWSLYFCSTKCTDSLTLKHDSFQIKTLEKPHTVLLLNLALIFKL